MTNSTLFWLKKIYIWQKRNENQWKKIPKQIITLWKLWKQKLLLKTNKGIVFQVIFKVITRNCASYLIEFIECAMRAITIDYIKVNV